MRVKLKYSLWSLVKLFQLSWAPWVELSFLSWACSIKVISACWFKLRWCFRWMRAPPYSPGLSCQMKQGHRDWGPWRPLWLSWSPAAQDVESCLVMLSHVESCLLSWSPAAPPHPAVSWSVLWWRSWRWSLWSGTPPPLGWFLSQRRPRTLLLN